MQCNHWSSGSGCGWLCWLLQQKKGLCVTHVIMPNSHSHTDPSEMCVNLSCTLVHEVGIHNNDCNKCMMFCVI